MDESVFSTRSYKCEGWNLLDDPVQLNSRFQEQPLVIVCGLISPEVGVVHMEVVEKDKDFKAFKGDNFVDILEAVREAYPERSIAIFLDNLSAHKCSSVRATAALLDIELIFNIPYQPQLNGIEFYWGEAKRRYRATIGENKINQYSYDNFQVVNEVLKGCDDVIAIGAAKQGLKNLENARPIQELEEEDSEEEKEQEHDQAYVDRFIHDVTSQMEHLVIGARESMGQD